MAAFPVEGASQAPLVVADDDHLQAAITQHSFGSESSASMAPSFSEADVILQLESAVSNNQPSLCLSSSHRQNDAGEKDKVAVVDGGGDRGDDDRFGGIGSAWKRDDSTAVASSTADTTAHNNNNSSSNNNGLSSLHPQTSSAVQTGLINNGVASGSSGGNDIVASRHHSISSANGETSAASARKIRLLLLSGRCVDFTFSVRMTIGQIKEHVLDHWPQEWKEERIPFSPSCLRILLSGRFIDDRVPLEELSLLPNQRTTMHLVIREMPPLDEPANGDDLKVRHRHKLSTCQACGCLVA